MAGGSKNMGLLVLGLMLLFLRTTTVVVEGIACCSGDVYTCCLEGYVPTAMTPMSANFTGNKKFLGRKAYFVTTSITHH